MLYLAIVGQKNDPEDKPTTLLGVYFVSFPPIGI